MSSTSEVNKSNTPLEVLQNWGKNSLHIIQKHSQISDIKILEHKDIFPVREHWLTMVTLSSKSFTIRFKLFFATEDCIHFCNTLYNKKPNEIIFEHMVDYTKEFCNLLVGRIKYNFELKQTHCISSLPMSLRSFDDLFFVQNLKNKNYEHFWKFQRSNHNLVSCLSLEITDLEIFSSIKLDFDLLTKDGVFELL
jgi:hypothetical protein